LRILNLFLSDTRSILVRMYTRAVFGRPAASFEQYSEYAYISEALQLSSTFKLRSYTWVLNDWQRRTSNILNLYLITYKRGAVNREYTGTFIV